MHQKEINGANSKHAFGIKIQFPVFKRNSFFGQRKQFGGGRALNMFLVSKNIIGRGHQLSPALPLCSVGNLILSTLPFASPHSVSLFPKKTKQQQKTIHTHISLVCALSPTNNQLKTHSGKTVTQRLQI